MLNSQLLNSRFADTYYILNTALVLFYTPLRLYFQIVTPDGCDYGTLHSLHEFSTWEKQGLASFVIALVWQIMRRRSWDHFAQGVFFYGKIITALTAYLIDQRIMAWYLLLCWIAITVCPQPMLSLFSGSSDDVIAGLDPTRMKDLVMHAGDTAWVVYFYAEHHQASIDMAPAFHAVAKEYSSSKLRFGCLEASLWSNYCKDTFKVTASTWTAHLPAVVLYSKGKEVSRLPRPQDIDDIGLKKNKYTKGDVIKKLNLERFR